MGRNIARGSRFEEARGKMSYNLSVSGHSVTETPDEAKQIEEQALAQARSFVNGLTDATSAMFDGQHTGHTDLMEKVEPTQETAA